MILGDAIFFLGRSPCWDGYRYNRVGRAEKSGGSNASILLKRKDEPKVTVLPAAEGALKHAAFDISSWWKYLMAA